MKERLDILLVKRNLAPSREKAKAMIMEGNVFVNNQREDKAGSSFDENVPIEIHGTTLKYVSRGGLKLEKAMNEFDLNLDGDICMDIGASTGGFKLKRFREQAENNQNSRIENLFSKLGLQDYFLDESGLSVIPTLPGIDYNLVKERMSIERERSLSYLKKSLER